MIRLISILILLSNCLTAFCGDFSTWQTKTPRGNSLCFADYGFPHWSIECRFLNGGSGIYIDYISKVYFYKESIIGQVRNEQFFVFKESDCTAQFFQSKQELYDFLEDNQLKPKFCTRWHKEDWRLIIPSDELGSSMSFLFFKLPLLILLFVVTLIGLVWVEKKSVRLAQIIFFSIWIIIIIRAFLDIYPNSF